MNRTIRRRVGMTHPFFMGEMTLPPHILPKQMGYDATDASFAPRRIPWPPVPQLPNLVLLVVV